MSFLSSAAGLLLLLPLLLLLLTLRVQTGCVFNLLTALKQHFTGCCTGSDALGGTFLTESSVRCGLLT